MFEPQSVKPLTLKGLYPATVTPFTVDGDVDYVALRRHLDETAAVAGVQGLVVNAGIGELMQLSDEEKIKILALTREVLRPGQLLISGVEGRGRAAVKDANLAKEGGADALLVLPPFDSRPYRRLARDPDAVYQFFKMLDEEVDLPMIIFQYPDSSGCAYTIEALSKAATVRNVVAIKAACSTVTRYVEIWGALKDKVSILAAVDSPPLLGMLLHGSHGALIGISVIDPASWVALVESAMADDAVRAQQIHRDFCIPLMDGVFDNQEPKTSTSEVACVKEALRQLGQIPVSDVRGPAQGVTQADREHINRSLRAAGLKALNV